MRSGGARAARPSRRAARTATLRATCLLTDQVFLPFEAPISSLGARTAAARPSRPRTRSGLKIRVAVIAFTSDLGHGRQRSGATRRTTRSSSAASSPSSTRNRLLISMPSGFGFYNEPQAGRARSRRRRRRSAGRDADGRSPSRPPHAVRALAAAEGSRCPKSRPAAATTSATARSSPRPSLRSSCS